MSFDRFWFNSLAASAPEAQLLCTFVTATYKYNTMHIY